MVRYHNRYANVIARSPPLTQRGIEESAPRRYL
jgi:hypothetical protein